MLKVSAHTVGWQAGMPNKLQILVHTVRWQTEAYLTSYTYQVTLSGDRQRHTWQATDISSHCQVTDWGIPDELKIPVHMVRWQAEVNFKLKIVVHTNGQLTMGNLKILVHVLMQLSGVNLTNWRYHLTHCQMTDWVEPDKLKISFDTLSDDRLSGTWQTKDIIWHTVRWQTVWNVTSRRYHLTHCQMTDCGEPDKHMISVDTPSDDGARWAWQKVTLLLLTRWTTGQETGWLCWPPEACGPQRCSLWSYSGGKKLTMRTILQKKMLLILN